MGSYLKNEDIAIGEHCWALDSKELVVVLKTGENKYTVCGPWECYISSRRIDILEVIKKPENQNKAKLYYIHENKV